MEYRQSISVIIPTYNEEKIIEKSLVKVVSYLKKKFTNYEIIVVDDSSDRTAKKVTSLAQKNKKIKLLRNKRKEGKGYSVKKGILHAKHPLILFLDADLSTPIEELSKFMPLLKRYDIIIASRNLEDSNIKIKQPFYRVALGRSFSILVNLLILLDIKDTQCGFKLFKNEVAKHIFNLQTLNGFSFDAEILYLAKKNKYKIKEIPVTWINADDSKVSSIRDPIKMLLSLLKIRLNNLRGLYN
jgi:dolichyl-phosphate beta-glucosyltransferase